MAEASVIKDFLVALGFQTDNAGLGQMREAMGGLELKAKALNATLMALATGAVIAIKQTASELDKLYFSSQRIGASATNITAYGNAIAQLGGNAEGAISTLESLAEKLRNSPGHAGMINSLGVQTKDANGQIRDRVEVMKDLSSVLAKMPDYQANSYANALGIDQNTLLAMKDGKFLSNMEKYQKIQKELGMNDELTKSGNDFMTEYQDLTMVTKTGFQVIVMQAGKALIPILKLINQWVQSGIHAFSQLNPEIKNMLGVGMRFALLAVVMGGFIKTFGLLFKFVPLLKGLIGIWRAFNLAFLASPIGIILGLAAALALLWDDYNNWKDGGESLIDWSNWTEGIEGAFAVLKDIQNNIVQFKDKAIEAFNALDPSIQDLIKNVLKFGAIGVVFAKFGGATKVLLGAKSAMGGLRRAAKLMLKAFKFTPIGRAVALIGLLISAVNFLMKDFEKWKNGERSLIDWNKWSGNIDKVMQKIRDFLNLLNNIKDKVMHFVQKVVSDPVGAIKEVASIAGEEVKKVAESLNEGKSGEVIKTLTEVGRNIAEGASGLIGKGFNAVSNHIAPEESQNYITPVEPKKDLPLPKEQPKTETPKGSKALADFAQNSLFHSLTENVQTMTNKGIELFTGVASKVQNQAKEAIAISSDSKPYKTAMTKFEGGLIKGFTPEQTLAFANRVMYRENRAGKLDTVNWAGYTGKYQFGAEALAQTGFIKRDRLPKDRFITLPYTDKKSGKTKYKFNPAQHKDFLANNKNWAIGNWQEYKQSHQMQDTSFRKLVESNLKSSEKVHKNSVKTMMGFAMASHLKGAAAAKRWYENGKDSKDGNNTKTSDYAKFGEGALDWVQPKKINPETKIITASNYDQTSIKNVTPPLTNPDKSQINTTYPNMLASGITINQEFKTDMTINGASNPVESANAVKRQQESSLTIMARNAKSILV